MQERVNRPRFNNRVDLLFGSVVAAVKRPGELVALRCRVDGEMRALRQYSAIIERSELEVEVVITETVAESWASGRMELRYSDGRPLALELSSICTLQELRELLARSSDRPARFVRLMIGAAEVTKTSELPQEPFVLEVQEAPKVSELAGRGVKLLGSLSGEELELETRDLVSLQELRERIAADRGMRATGVKLLSPRWQQLWDARPFELCELLPGQAVSVCVRDPGLCRQGLHEELTFSNNGYNDRVCIHCGDEFFMAGRQREPLGRPGW